MAETLEHLFRRESGRMTSALTRLFGVHNLPLVEDVVSDALVRALEVWKFRGMPENPSAWLMATAKHRALDLLRREKTARTYAPDLTDLLSTEWSLVPTVSEAFGDDALRDEELKMMFACCHARVPEDAQIALMLNLLGGFSVHELAAAFLVGEEAMGKRLQRGKQALAKMGKLLEVTSERVVDGLDTVLRAIYLLFNEGYHGAHPTHTTREELCAEAIRLATLLARSTVTGTPATHALLALMCLNAARIPGRIGPDGGLIPLADQDRSKWDASLVERGIASLEESATGDRLTPYHVEAAIAYEHATAPSHPATRFARIVALYDMLLAMRPSPVVALSRAIAIGELEGPERALEEIRAIQENERLREYPFYAAAIGEQLLRAGHKDEARARFREAVRLARSPTEARYLEGRAAACDI